MRRATLAAIALLLLIGTAQAMPSGDMAKLTKVVSGNTISVELRGKETTIRLVGVATPDPNDPKPILKQLGTEASAFLAEFLKSGWVYLEYPNGTPAPDANGVVDAYVYRASDAVLVNEKIIHDGFGITNRKMKFAYQATFIEAEDKAKAISRGVWSSFKEAGGKQAASGNMHQMEYIGKAAPAGYGFVFTDNYVLIWIAGFQR
jgi:micrococcal nuclease